MDQMPTQSPAPVPAEARGTIRDDRITPVGKEEIDALTGVRGVAAVVVIIYHIYPFWTFPWGMRQLVARGYLSVDVFFVLSGFVMALNYGHMFRTGFNRAGFGTFLLRRIARLYPLYIVFLALRLGYSLLAYQSLHVKDFWFAVDLDHPVIVSLLSNALMIQSWGIAKAITNPTWSISVEWGAYFVFPFIVAAILYGRLWTALLATAIAAGFVSVVPWLTLYDGMGHNGRMDAFDGRTVVPMVRCLGGFALGICTYRLYRWAPARALAAKGGWLVCLFLLAGVLFHWNDLIVYAGFPFLVLCLACDKGSLGRLFSSWPVFQAGVLSYAIYVIHNPWIGPFNWAEKHLPQHMPYWLAETIISLVLATSIFGVAIVLHRLVEVPGRRWVRRMAAPFAVARRAA